MIKKIKTAWKINRCRILVLAGLLVVLITQGSVVYGLARSYKTTDATIKPGMVVAVLAQDKNIDSVDTKTINNVVQKASQSRAELTLGVVIAPGASELTYSAGELGEILVANSGRVPAYVSDLNGAPSPGDLLAVSPLEGILMRATDGAKGVVGALSEKFPGTSVETQALKDGKKVQLSALLVDLDVRPQAKITAGSNPLQRFIESVISRKVTALQAFIALILVLITAVITGSIMYAAVAHYLVAVGRNPLAHRQLTRGLLQMFGLILGVLVIGIISTGAVLWL